MATIAEVLDRGWGRHQAGDYAAAEKAYGLVIKHAPTNAAAWCYLGILKYDQKRFAESDAAYVQSLKLKPDFPVALSNRSNTLVALERFEEAEQCCRAALALDANYATAHLNLGAVLSSVGRWDEAEACFERTLELTPNNAVAHGGLGGVYTSLGRFDDAERHADMALEMNPRLFEAVKNRGILKLIHGSFGEGWRDYEARFRVDVPPPPSSAPVWRGESLEGKSIIACSEQGLGDTIHFVRFIEALIERKGRVVVACQEVLLPLLRGMKWGDQVEWIPNRDELPASDYVISLMSLPGVLGVDEETIPADVPYLLSDPQRVAAWRDRLAVSGAKRRIGIAWQGNPQHSADAIRSTSLEQFQPLWNSLGDEFDWVSLQKGFGEEQIGERFPVLKLELDKDGAFLDSAAIMQSLDAVVATDSAVAHLAGATGRPVFVALAAISDWRWMTDRSDSPWYPTMRLIRQPSAGDWPTVFHAIAEALADLLK